MNLEKRWREEISKNKFEIIISIIFFGIALYLNYLAGKYVNRVGDLAVSDLILDFIPSINLSWLYLYGFLLIGAVLIFYPLFFKVKEFHIVLSQFSLLILIRSFFITLTHLKLPADAIMAWYPSFFNFLMFNNDLFFSAHTAIPFLGFLLFRKQKIGRFFLISTVILASTVLLMHVHYSIDVFAAFFITYGSYKATSLVFKRINKIKNAAVKQIVIDKK